LWVCPRGGAGTALCARVEKKQKSVDFAPFYVSSAKKRVGGGRVQKILRGSRKSKRRKKENSNAALVESDSLFT